MAQPDPIKKSSPLLIALAWLIVIVPTAWGRTTLCRTR
jgi:hypothetical protein